jgi:pyruvate ferredoxin oxidoreductase alpha subunit
MTVANRAIGAPINIWNDHSDAMSQRDCGWLQLYATTNQEAADLHILAFRLAEELSIPVMVCMDGFVLTHAVEEVDLPDQSTVDEFLPTYEPRQQLDPADPVTIGAMVGPEAFTEVRYLAHRTQLRALDRIPALAAELSERLVRDVPALVTPYRSGDAELVVVVLGSVFGTLCDTIDELRDEGRRVGAVAVHAFRPFPAQALRAVVPAGARVLVVERAFAVGVGGIVTQDVRAALDNPLSTVVAGLGGRPVLRSSLARVVRGADTLEPLTFLDLNMDLVP